MYLVELLTWLFIYKCIKLYHCSGEVENEKRIGFTIRPVNFFFSRPCKQHFDEISSSTSGEVSGSEFRLVGLFFHIPCSLLSNRKYIRDSNFCRFWIGFFFVIRSNIFAVTWNCHLELNLVIDAVRFS